MSRRGAPPAPLVHLAALSAAALVATAAPAQVPGPPLEKTEATVPMRDGVRLKTVIVRPKGADGPLPILLDRTPYDAGRAEARVRGPLRELFDDGYIVALQDVRGRYGSEGDFAMLRPPRDPADPGATDESTDAYDAIDWLVENVPGNNGRVGLLGVSYDGWTTLMGMIDPHPALKAASPQAPMVDTYLGDDFFHNGAFRLSYSFEYSYMMENAPTSTLFPFDRKDTFEWYLAVGPLADAGPKTHRGRLPSWDGFVAHPDYDDYWRRRAATTHLRRPAVPTLVVGGWYDQEDFFGPLAIYSALEKEDDGGRNSLVMGPWNHGGWGNGAGDRLGGVEFGEATARTYREQVQVPFFARHLKGRDAAPPPEARSFRTGANAWQSYDRWPPRGATPRRLYARAGHRLAFEPPDADADKGFDEYTADPARPVPYRARPIAPIYGPGSTWSSWLVQDQRFAHLRPDVLSLATEPLERDLDVAGPIVAHLLASTSGTDCDWVVKVIDVYPDDDRALGGQQIMVASEVFRARFRDGFDRPRPVPPDEVREYTIDTHGTDHRFKAGHRIMLQVQSSWFPLIDRNPQTFVPNIFRATKADFRPATQRLFRTPGRATYVELPVISE